MKSEKEAINKTICSKSAGAEEIRRGRGKLEKREEGVSARATEG